MDTLKEKASRYKRLSENEDFQKTMEEMAELFGLKQNVYGVLKAGLSTDFVLAKEGTRALYDKILGLADEYEQAVRNEEENTKGEIDE